MRVSRFSAALLVCVFLAVMLATACKSSTTATNIPPQRRELHYDSANANSPNLPGATYQAAARFPAAQTAALAGGALIEVEFYISSLPTNATLKVYDEGTSASPGTLLYAAPVAASLTPPSWTTHVLTAPVVVSGGDLWIAIEFTHPLAQRVIGCDSGPAVPDGDWLYSSSDGMWIPFSQRFAVSVNWNIRGIVEK
jgi:hypothetical protein